MGTGHCRSLDPGSALIAVKLGQDQSRLCCPQGLRASVKTVTVTGETS